MWWGAHDPGRLDRELERLKGLGVGVVRILAGFERKYAEGTAKGFATPVAAVRARAQKELAGEPEEDDPSDD